MIQLLDCTLRDGGYINNWNFKDEVKYKLIDSLITSNIEFIEIGYLNEKQGKDSNSTINKDIEKVNKDLLSYDKEFLIMINHGDYEIEKLKEFKIGEKVNGIRYVFKKEEIEDSIKNIITIKEKGYKVFVQPMQTIKYSDLELLELLLKINEVGVEAVYIVDSFGEMKKEDFTRFFHLYANNLNQKIKIGFHSHNNKQLSFSLAMEFCEIKKNREIIIDSSCFGMGRGAGNLNTELVMDYLNSEYDKNYYIDSILEVVDDYILPIYNEKKWGYSIPYFLSASYNCHPNYGEFLLTKKTLTMKSIRKILSKISDDKKNKFDKEYIDYLYLEHNSAQKKFSIIRDSRFENKRVLLISPGNEVLNNLSKIERLIKEEDIIVISINHLSLYVNAEYIFYSNEKRLMESKILSQNSKIIKSSNLNLEKYEINIDYKHFVTENNGLDNSSLILIRFLIESGVEKLYIAGMDGYKKNEKNYYLEEFSKQYTEEEVLEKNRVIGEELSRINNNFRLTFITPSLYQNYFKKSILGVIPARYKSSRLEGKPLIKIKGIELIKRTYNRCIQSKVLDEIVVATDDDRIYSFCKKENINVIMTSENCVTGTDRVAEVSNIMDYDLYLNIQGDEPIIDPLVFEEIINEYNIHKDNYVAYNSYKIIEEIEEIESNTIIKVINNEFDELMYMSRYPIPFNKGTGVRKYLKQVCVYGFTKKALEIFSSREKTINEKYEDIEILRFLDLGYKVKMVRTETDSIAVDVSGDIKKVEKYLEENGIE